ncbi:MAG: hypothetical protein HY023_00435 [Chloroflexi bacterium]|nr:hypothetical protein [Chloroflexota bacterium]
MEAVKDRRRVVTVSGLVVSQAGWYLTQPVRPQSERDDQDGTEGQEFAMRGA